MWRLALFQGGGRLLVLVLVAAAVVWQLSSLATSRPGEADSGQAAIRLERLRLSDDNRRADVALHVTAGPDDLGPLSVFWTITVPGDQQPWQAPRYVAPAQTLPSLRAGTGMTLDWPDTPLLLPPGDYSVDAWVHQVLPSGQTQHLAGGALETLRITQPVPTSIRLEQAELGEPTGPLTVGAIAIDQDPPADQRVVVRVDVANRGAAPASGRAYWVLGRLPDDQPFLAPFWQAQWLPIPTLQPGESKTLSWSEPVALPSSTYGLSVWVHTLEDTRWEHSDRSIAIPLALGPNLAGIQRAGPPTGGVRMRSARLQGGVLQVATDNQGPAQRVAVAVATLDETRRFDWYRAAPPPRTLDESIPLPGGASSTIELPLALDCASEAHLARIAVYAENAPADGDPTDDVLADACT